MYCINNLNNETNDLIIYIRSGNINLTLNSVGFSLVNNKLISINPTKPNANPILIRLTREYITSYIELNYQPTITPYMLRKTKENYTLLLSYIEKLICSKKLTNNTNPNINSTKNPNWDYCQKVQYNPSGNAYLSNMKALYEFQRYINQPCRNENIDLTYVKSFDELLIQQKAKNIRKDIFNIFL